MTIDPLPGRIEGVCYELFCDRTFGLIGVARFFWGDRFFWGAAGLPSYFVIE